MKPLYFLLHVFTVSFPLIRSFEPKIQFAKKWKALFPAIFIAASFFLLWDVYFTKSGVWGFNNRYLLGMYLFRLPIEEWLFFFSVPFASVFIYECVVYFWPSLPFSKEMRALTLLTGSCLLLLSILNDSKMYTFWNFLFSGAFLTGIAIKNPSWLGHFWIAYFIHLIPFLFVNGILTGSLLKEPIVWYNNDENLNIRLLTIPIEDTIYALLLLLMNITFYERLKIFLIKVKT